MKGIIYHIVLIIGLLAPLAAQSQSEPKPEHAHLWTDRAIYITGETIRFSGTIDGGNSISQVAYIELITPNGEKVNQNKLHIKEGLFYGGISIPSEILSGYYYLRAYTKWMRNGSADNYPYILVKIINPKTHELLLIPDSLINNKLLNGQELDQDSNNIQLKKRNYHAGEDISFELNTQYKDISISVIPKVSEPFYIRAQTKQTANYSQLLIYPETRGLTLSGKLKSKKNEKALGFHMVNIHIIGEKDMVSVLSDSSGRFHFALPERSGKKELFIIASSLEKDEVQILIDQDFCYQPISLQVPEFSIPEKDQASILKMTQNHQVYEMFHEDDTIVNHFVKYKAFYGEAFKTINFSFYVPLDSLEQYFTDIPSWVLIKKRKGKRYFQIIGSQDELKLYKPLVLVDWVPVDDANRVLAIQPSGVDRVDIITQSYVHGDIIYGGIINILTKKSDFGGIKFPASGMYLNFDFYNKTILENSQELKFTNTYSWIPQVGNSKTKKINLIAPQQKGEYIILFQGMEKSGKKIHWHEHFIVD